MKNFRLQSLLTSENAIYAVILLLSLAYAWFTPGGNKSHKGFVFGFLALGIFFDLMSLFFHTMTLITRKYMSGFPYVGLFFYGWFLLAAKFSLVAQHETSVSRILSFKLVDAVVLVAFHFFCQFPERLQGPRDKYK